MKKMQKGSEGHSARFRSPIAFMWTGRTWACAAIMLALTLTGWAGGGLDVGKRAFKTFNANAYVGADLAPALTVDPSNLPELIATTTAIYSQVLRSDPPARLAGLAQELATTEPDVAGLVEMYTLEVAPMTARGPGQFEVVFDYLNLLTNALQAQGNSYQVAVVSTESDIILPLIDVRTGDLVYGRLTDHEVILNRNDLPPGFLKVSNPQSGQFSHFIEIPGVGLAINRGWCSVDVFTRGETFRYICTHLEEETVPVLQYVQAQELLAGPANTTIPIILTGDFNADPLHRNGTVTFDLLAQAGFTDTWTSTHPTDTAGGLTWGHDPLLADASLSFIWRIDLVLYRGAGFQPAGMQVIDMELGNGGAPLWPSDHAAVAANFMFSNARLGAVGLSQNR